MRCTFAALLAGTGLLCWAKRKLRRDGAIVVLMLHRVLPENQRALTNTLGDIVVHESTFRDLVAYVKNNGEVLSLAGAQPGTHFEKPLLVLTFDDGWRDNYSVALRHLQAANLPFTIFICPNLMGAHTPFWPERASFLLKQMSPPLHAKQVSAAVEALKRRSPQEREDYLSTLTDTSRVDKSALQSGVDQLLSWTEVLQMRTKGVAFGAHSHNHLILTQVPLTEAQVDVEASKTAVENALSTPCDMFSYPNGNWSVEIRQIVAAAGFRLAVTTEPAAWTPGADLLTIPRINISEDNITGQSGRFSRHVFEYHAFWKPWRRLRRSQHQERDVTLATSGAPSSSRATGAAA